MFGFLTAFSLVGIAAAAWPIYLHLYRERRRRIQVVPSLRLFRWRTSPARSRLVEDLLLLLSRAGIIAALALLLSQPFVELARDLPLPSIAAAREEDHLLGLVIDDGLSAFHGATEAERFERARGWLLEQLDRLPESVEVSVITTTYPRPTGLLAREEARALLAGMRPVPREGNAAEALARMAGSFGERRGALVVAAPLESPLWPSAEGGKARPGARKVFFLDTTRWRNDAFIRRVLPGPGGSGLTCELAGDPESLVGKELCTRGRKGKPASRRRISLHEALRRSVALDGAALEEEAVKLSLEGGPASRHPWSAYHLVTGDRAASAARLVVFLEDSPEAVLAARIVDSTVKAVRPDLPRSFVAFPELADGPPPAAGAAVFVASRPAPPEADAWLERQIEAGIQVLCVPAGSRTALADGGEATASRSLPAWGQPVHPEASEWAPLKVGASKVPDTHRLDEILLGELSDLERPILREPHFAGGSSPVIATSGGKPLLSLARPNERSAFWALGVPIDLDEGGLAYHPVFPLLLKWILFPSFSPRDEGARGGALVGESVNAGPWFGASPPRGKLVLPSGGSIPLGRSRAGTDWISISEAGIYELRSEAGSRLRAANHPRPSEGGLLERRSWQEAFPVAEAVWLDGEDRFVTLAELAESPVSPGEKPSRRYDLSGPAAVLIAAFLVAELACLYRCWRRVKR